jgi:hypothetical protein
LPSLNTDTLPLVRAAARGDDIVPELQAVVRGFGFDSFMYATANYHLRPDNDDGSGLRLESAGRAFGDAGFYRIGRVGEALGEAVEKMLIEALDHGEEVRAMVLKSLLQNLRIQSPPEKGLLSKARIMTVSQCQFPCNELISSNL